MKELLEKRKAYFDQMEALDALAEDGKLSDEQRSEYEGLLANVDSINKEIKFEEKREAAKVARAAAAAGTQKESKEEKEVAKRFSFGAAVRAAYGEKLEGVEKEMHQEGEKEMRSIGKSASGVVIPTTILESRANITENGTTGVETQSFVQGVYANTILGQLGVTTITSSMDQRIPVIPSVTTQWEGETDAAADGGSALSKVDLTPKRLASYLNYSKQAAMQHNESLEGALRSAIQQAIGAKVEYAVFTDDSSNGAYNHLANGKTAVTGATMKALILAVVEEVIGNNQNAGSLGFAISHDLFSELHQADLVASVAPLYMNGQIMGNPALVSSQIADVNTDKPAVYYGNWSKLNIAQFGGIEILADPYTQAVSGMNRLVLNSYWDAALSQDAAISVGGYTG